MIDKASGSDDLQRSLARVHELLARSPRIEEGSKRALRDLLADIERLLGRESVPPGSQSRLEALAVGFESEHPSLAAGVREFIDLLGQAGL
ncbi:MAG TPA: DUF4404 family protein [Steroidobacteraceae bacterium]|jgi:hypothetical protein